MVFSSAVFLFIFLPVVILLHTFIQNTKVRNGLLIVASLVFYAFGEPVYVVMLIGSVAVNYIFGTLLTKKKNKAVLSLSIVANLALLVVFKYTGFIVTSINRIFLSNSAQFLQATRSGHKPHKTIDLNSKTAFTIWSLSDL